MRYALQSYDHTFRIEIEGELTFADSMFFCRLISKMKNDPSVQDVIINLKKVYFIDSTGLALLMMAYDLAKKNHISIVFEEPQPQVLQVIARATPYNALTIAA